MGLRDVSLRVALGAVKELCGRYHTTMVFSTATQQDFAARKGFHGRLAQ